MSGAHSPLAPSSAERAVPCPGSVRLEAMFPETESNPDALDGEAAHWGLAEMLGGRDVAVGERAPNGVFLTQEMIDGALLMVEDIEAELAPFGMVPQSGAIEVAVSIPNVHAMCWGTPDYRHWLPTVPRPTLLLYDFKFGHRQVEVFENPQMVDYASGCISATSLNDLQIDVIVKIVQPRAFHRDGSVREWRFPASDIRGLVNIRKASADEALGPDPRTKSGAHCRDCKARYACPTNQSAGFAAMDYSGKAVPLDLTAEAMGLELVMVDESIKRLEARKTGLEAQVVASLKAGKSVPHWSMQTGKGRERWAKPDATIIAIGKALNVDVSKPPEAITPKQAVARGFPLVQMPELAESPRTAAALTRDDGTKARRIFGR